MKQLIFVFYILSFAQISFSQIDYDYSQIEDLEISQEQDFYLYNQVMVITETTDGFVYVNRKTKIGENLYTVIKKTNNNLEVIDSVVYEELGLETEVILFWDITYDNGTDEITLFGLNGLFNNLAIFYKIRLDNNLEVVEIKSFEYENSLRSTRRHLNFNGEYFFLIDLWLPGGSDQVKLLKVNSDFELQTEVELPYGWTFVEGMTLSADGNIHIALSTGTVTFDNELNIVASNEIEGMAEYEYTCTYQRKTVNLDQDNQYFGGICKEFVLDSISPWITEGELRRERIFKYNEATGTFQSFFNAVPFGFDYDYSIYFRFHSFDAIKSDRLYLGNNFTKILSVNEVEYVFSINSVDSTGNKRWSKLFGSLEHYTLYEVIALEDDGVLLIIEGLFPTSNNTAIRNVYYMKLDKDGNIEGTTGIPGLAVYDNFINIYPNPATEQFTIENFSKWEKNTQIQVFNAFGQIMATQEIQSELGKINFNSSDWATGVFYVQIYSDKTLVATKKIVIR